MMRINTIKQGFSAVEAIIIIVVLVIVGALGYTFYNRSQAPVASNETEMSVPKTADEAKAQTSQVKTELEAIDIDKELDTTDIDTALE